MTLNGLYCIANQISDGFEEIDMEIDEFDADDLLKIKTIVGILEETVGRFERMLNLFPENCCEFRKF